MRTGTEKSVVSFVQKDCSSQLVRAGETGRAAGAGSPKDCWSRVEEKAVADAVFQRDLHWVALHRDYWSGRPSVVAEVYFVAAGVVAGQIDRIQ